jgi:hypothetical protein
MRVTLLTITFYSKGKYFTNNLAEILFLAKSLESSISLPSHTTNKQQPKPKPKPKPTPKPKQNQNQNHLQKKL